MNNNYLENWFSLKWFTIEQLTSFEWENHLYLYLLFLIPIFYLLRNILVKKTSYEVTIPKRNLTTYKFSLCMVFEISLSKGPEFPIQVVQP